MATRRAPSMGRKVATVTAAALALVAVAGAAAAWQDAHPARGVFCTAAGSGGTPIADTPEEAFESWWDEWHPDGPALADAEVHRSGSRRWEVDEGTPEWIRVTVDRADHFDPEAPHDRWAVSGANSCSYADA